MDPPQAFHCPGCGDAFSQAAYSAHLAERRKERHLVFDLYVADEEGEATDADQCTGAAEIVPLMDAAEQGRFGIDGSGCVGIVLQCPCGGSFCGEHTFVCATCGRFACLRHRWSAKCPTCSTGERARPVRVEKYDVFSKQRSTFVRRYPRAAPVEPWDRLVRKER